MLQTSASEKPVELLRDTTAALFVINLCASTTPVALAHPASAELKRFTFFVTRRREEGRERFRLHMGYFENLADAEAMLAVVRDVYPAAWAGPAPESRAPSRGPRPSMVAVKPANAAPVAPDASSSAPAPAPAPAPAHASASASASEVAAPVVVAPAFELESMSNVREVLAELTDDPRSAALSKPVAAAIPAAAPPTLPAAALPAKQTPVKQPPKQPSAKQPPVKLSPALTPAQTLRVLESPAPDTASGSTANNIRVLTPDDTQTLRDIRLEAQRNAPASYAVQLVWAVQPIDMQALPHLAIFDAYTLYHVEGNRQGRRWYGLRLGFFTDAGAAKQVAHYVRSEYSAVAVVPVTAKEKDGARAPTLAAAPLAVQANTPPRPEAAKIPTVRPLDKGVACDAGIAGFELLPDDKPVAAKRDLDDAAPAAAPRMPPKATGRPAGKRAVVRPSAKPSPPGAPQPLESTLEILGASTLTIDESREIINDSAIRKARPKKEKAGRFARLLNRLSDRRDA